MKRLRAARPVTLIPAAPSTVSPLDERRAAAFARVWPLLSTSIPTGDIVASYLAEVVGP